MFRFHYDFVKRHYGLKAQLLFTDTDSLMYEIESERNPTDFFFRPENRDQFDFSNYPEKHRCRDTTNKMMIGLFKDEANGSPIVEFAGLRPKMYSYLTLVDIAAGKVAEKFRAKGIQMAASRVLQHRDFVAQLDRPAENYLINRRIGANNHQIHTNETDIRGLCAFDDKRFLCPDGISTLAFGHRRADPHILIEREIGPDRDIFLSQPKRRRRIPRPSLPSSSHPPVHLRTTSYISSFLH
jgi:hypothetical protein